MSKKPNSIKTTLSRVVVLAHLWHTNAKNCDHLQQKLAIKYKSPLNFTCGSSHLSPLAHQPSPLEPKVLGFCQHSPHGEMFSLLINCGLIAAIAAPC